MPARLPYALMLALSTLGWFLVTRGAFDESRRGHGDRNLDGVDRPSAPIGADGVPLAPLRLRLEGPSPDACLGVANTGSAELIVQSGRGLRRHRFDQGAPRARGSLELPVSCYVWSLFGDPARDRLGVVSLGATAVQAQSFSEPEPAGLAESGDLFRGLPTRPPLFRSFVLADDVGGLDFVVPEIDRLRWYRLDLDAPRAELVRDVAITSLAEQTLGYGLADEMSSRVTVPFFHLARSTTDRVLLFRRGGRLLRVRPEGVERPFGRAPQGGKREILGFDHSVPPLAADWDGDGETDVAFSMPGDGTVLAYRSSTRVADDERGPDQALAINGWILHHWLIDGNGDGRLDLALLEVPKLDMLGQLGVLRKRSMEASLTLRPQLGDGSFDRTPAWSHGFSLPLAITLKRKERFVEFPTPVAPLLDPRDGLLLLHPGDEGLELSQWSGDGFETRHQLGPLPESATVLSPFAPVFAQLDGVGGLDLAMVVVTEDARYVEVFRLP